MEGRSSPSEPTPNANHATKSGSTDDVVEPEGFSVPMPTIVVLATAAAGAMWWLPRPKPEAVLGRLDFVQFVTAVVLTSAWFVVTAVACVPSARRRSVGFRLCAVWFSVMLAAGAGELLCAVIPFSSAPNPWLVEQRPDAIHQDTRGLFYERKPHIVWEGRAVGGIAAALGRPDPYAEFVRFETDDDGFRNSRDLDNADIVFIGDSHTEAGYLNERDTFASRTAEALGVTGRNLGRVHYSPSQELVVLRTYGLPCKPRAVVWQICEFNDLYGESVYAQWVQRGMPPMIPEELQAADWRQRSPTYQLFEWLRHREDWPYQGIFRDADGETHPMFFSGTVKPIQSPIENAGWAPLAEAIQAGAELLAGDGIELLVVLVPIKLRVMGHHIEFSELAQQELGTEWDFAESQTLSFALQQHCERLGIEYIDATPRLKQLAADGVMVFPPFDEHISASGHAAVAELLAQRLLQMDGFQLSSGQ